MTYPLPTDDEKEDVLLSCRYGELDEVKTFISQFGADALASIRDENGSNVLHMASGNGHDDILTYLLPLLPASTALALLTTPNTLGKSTPLHWAALNQHLATCKHLVQYGGPDLIDARNAGGRTPFDEAELAGWQEGALWFASVMNLDDGGAMEEEGAEAIEDEDVGELSPEAGHAKGSVDGKGAGRDDIEVEIQDADGQIARLNIAAKDVKR